jgi:hypothetical protein
MNVIRNLIDDAVFSYYLTFCPIESEMLIGILEMAMSDVKAVGVLPASEAMSRAIERYSLPKKIEDRLFKWFEKVLYNPWTFNGEDMEDVQSFRVKDKHAKMYFFYGFKKRVENRL